MTTHYIDTAYYCIGSFDVTKIDSDNTRTVYCSLNEALAGASYKVVIFDAVGAFVGENFPAKVCLTCGEIIEWGVEKVKRIKSTVACEGCKMRENL